MTFNELIRQVNASINSSNIINSAALTSHAHTMIYRALSSSKMAHTFSIFFGNCPYKYTKKCKPIVEISDNGDYKYVSNLSLVSDELLNEDCPYSANLYSRLCRVNAALEAIPYSDLIPHKSGLRADDVESIDFDYILNMPL